MITNRIQTFNSFHRNLHSYWFIQVDLFLLVHIICHFIKSLQKWKYFRKNCFIITKSAYFFELIFSKSWSAVRQRRPLRSPRKFFEAFSQKSRIFQSRTYFFCFEVAAKNFLKTASHQIKTDEKLSTPFWSGKDSMRPAVAPILPNFPTFLRIFRLSWKFMNFMHLWSIVIFLPSPFFINFGGAAKFDKKLLKSRDLFCDLPR